MDVGRREASGTSPNLMGPPVLPQDVQLRTIGLRRAAVRSLPVISPRTRAALQAYADGVNAFVGSHSHSLPPEYGALELTSSSRGPLLIALPLPSSLPLDFLSISILIPPSLS